MNEKPPVKQLSIPATEIIKMISSASSIEDIDLMIRYISKTPNKEEDPLNSLTQHTFTPEESRAISEAVNKRIDEVDESLRKELLNFLTWLKPPEVKTVISANNDAEEEDRD